MMRVLEDEKRGPNQMDRAEAVLIEGPRAQVNGDLDAQNGTIH